MKITSKQLRQMWIKFYEERGHVNIGSVSLIGDGTTGVMFNVAGMQPLMPYLLGEKHPKGTRLCNVQGCVRTNDIDSVGDESHCTFFEMMGSWSLGDYFKEERTKWSYELLTNVFGYERERIATTVFAGNEFVERDEETAKLREKSGFLRKNIYYLPKSDNWWELDRGPCGPDSEMFFITDKEACSKDCNPGCSCGHFIEIGNDVFMQYDRVDENKYLPLKQKNVDTGWGLERNLVYLNGLKDVYLTDVFLPCVEYLCKKANVEYGKDANQTKAIRIICDHIKTSTMLIGDVNGIVPSNVGAGYILRRLLRRAIRYSKMLNLTTEDLLNISKIYIEEIYNEAYPLLKQKETLILDEIKKEATKFERTLEQGTREFNKLVDNLTKFAPNNKKISGEKAFKLFDTFGFPLELTVEMANEKGFVVDTEGFKQRFKEHQEKSRSTNAGEFKGGLENGGEITTHYHTATHIMLAGLKKMFGDDVVQKGSNITNERMRFDFNLDHKMTEEEIAQLEKFVNDTIARKLDVTCQEMTLDEARKFGAHGVFDSKYGETVKVYIIGDVDKQICGGPHVKNTSELGTFKIVKEESSSAGIRRIKAILK